MKKIIYSLILIPLFLMLLYCSSTNEIKEDILEYVDPFIGTGFHGHTFPGATLPFGMVQLSPDTHLDGWDASSGYHYDDHQIFGFSHTHLSGTGIGDLGDVAFLPYSNSEEAIPVADLDKSSEVASPGYYKVLLKNYNIEVELTATLRVGMHRYSFQDQDDRKVMLNLAHILQPGWGGAVVDNHFEMVDDRTIQGIRKTTGWARDHVVAYRAEFSEPFEKVGGIINGNLTENISEDRIDQLHFKFPTSEKPLLLKVAISPVDMAGAAKNMEAELPGWDFEEVVQKAREEWLTALEVIRIETSSEKVKTNFYTALYHSMMAPFLWQDVDGRYRGINKKIMQAPPGYVNYTAFSLWDTFRAFHPLITIIQPEKAAKWSEALVQKYREGGILPKWPLASNYTGTMVGYPAVSVLADAVVKGLAPDDLAECLEASIQSATWRPEIVENFEGDLGDRVMPRHIYFKETLGWSPHDSIAQSVSFGLEMAYYDWCVAQIARKAGEHEIAAEFDRKGQYYQHYFDEETGLMRGKNYDGSWLTPFRPKFSDHDYADYVEGNAWQWSFFTPHAIDGVIDLYGSTDVYEAMLDTLFTTSSEIEGEHASGDITGLIGQYAHGNEPSHHMAYLYNWTNTPYKTQERLDQIMNDFYLPEPAGIIGNEDCGQMSAWYVLSALGFYQVCPGDPTYTIGRPMIDRAIIPVSGGEFEIIVHNNSEQNLYVDELRLNGKKLDKPFFSHEDIVKGGKLEFFMTSTRTK